MPMRVSRTFLLAVVLFFLSGALGLGYQLIWIHKASLLVGASQIALATVLTSFFLGLALGSLFVGRYLRSTRWSPLFVYGLFEVAIGIFALLFPILFRGAEAAYGAIYPALSSSPAALFALRFMLLFILFLVPTFFMGGTLPLLLDGLVGRDRSVGALTSFLYGLNILGAVAGVLATSYFAIPLLGLSRTSLIAGFCNLGIGAVALVAFRRLGPLHATVGSVVRPRVPAFFIVLGFASGFAAIAYQVLWARYFGMVSQPSVYFTAVLLAVFLSALAVGSMGLAPLLHHRVRPLRVLACTQPLVPILAFLTLESWSLATYRFKQLGHWEVEPQWALWSEVVDNIFILPSVRIAIVIFLPVMLLGAGLPTIIAAAVHRAEDLRSTAGRIVFWNMLGSSAGGLAAGYILIPVLGLTGGFVVAAAVSTSVAVAAEWRLSAGSKGLWRVARPGYGLAAAVVLFALVWSQIDITERTLQGHGNSKLFKEDSLIAIDEGPLTTAYVFDSPSSRSLGTGAVRMATAHRSQLMPQILQGHLPVLFYPREGWPRSVLGIALGTGQTFGALLRAPIERMDVVDISGEVVGLSLEYFAPFNNNLADDERVTFHRDDGRHFVDRAPDAVYDIVSLEPPPPTNDGIYRLYSLEFYEGVHRVLRDGGVLAQWLPLNLVTPDDVRAMIKTQASVFPYTFLIQESRADFLMVSIKTDAPPRFQTAWIEERLGNLKAERGVKGLRWANGNTYLAASVEGVISMLVAGPDDIARLEAPCIHRDDDQRLSYTSGDRWIMRRYLDRGLERLSFAALPVTPFEDLQAYFADRLPLDELEEDRARNLEPVGGVSLPRVTEATARFAAARTAQDRAIAALAVADLYGQGHKVHEALSWIEQAIDADPAHDRPASLRTVRQLVAENAVVSGADIGTWIAELPADRRVSPLAGAIDAELKAWADRDAKRRSRYVWERAR